MLLYNNPGNIKITGDRWQGQIFPGESNTFVTFSTLDYGFRALFKLIRNEIIGGNDTIEKLIYDWAPPSENDTESYINYLVYFTHYNRSDNINPDQYDLIYSLGLNMARFETGEQYFPQQSIDNGFKMAFPQYNQQSGKSNVAVIGLLTIFLLNG